MSSQITSDWRNSILNQLQERNRKETYSFQDLICQHNKIFESFNILHTENLQLNILNEKLKTEGRSGLGSNSSSLGDIRYQEKIQQLEQKLLQQAEELTELHRRKGENAQQIIDLNALVQEKDRIIAAKDVSLADYAARVVSFQTQVAILEKENKDLKYSNDTLKDEYQTNLLAFSALEEKLRKIQDENRQLVDRLIKYKAKDADKMNEENDNFLKKRYARMQKEIEEACRDTRGNSPDELPEEAGPTFQSTLPTKVNIRYDAHEGEVSAVKWSPVDRILATGGADRKLKLWNISKGTFESKGSLVGSNAGVMALDFDASGSIVLGASNDYATRVWTVTDHRLRHTLTGHSGKVMAAKFLGEATKVVTGSHDRTLKIWDLRSRACIETKFAGSSCNDLVSVDGSGSIIISGHFDKSIRFWDSRSESSCNNVVLNGKVTSLDLTRDSKYLVCCVRDDTLKLLDLRMNQVVTLFSCDGFKVGCDYARATFSPDGQYVAVGSSDGGVYIWSVSSGKVETILKEHTAAVTATSWHPFGTFLATVDRSRRTIIWSDG